MMLIQRKGLTLSRSVLIVCSIVACLAGSTSAAKAFKAFSSSLASSPRLQPMAQAAEAFVKSQMEKQPTMMPPSNSGYPPAQPSQSANSFAAPNYNGYPSPSEPWGAAPGQGGMSPSSYAMPQSPSNNMAPDQMGQNLQNLASAMSPLMGMLPFGKGGNGGGGMGAPGSLSAQGLAFAQSLLSAATQQPHSQQPPIPQGSMPYGSMGYPTPAPSFPHEPRHKRHPHFKPVHIDDKGRCMCKSSPKDLRCGGSKSTIPVCLEADLARERNCWPRWIKNIGRGQQGSVDLYVTQPGNFYAAKKFPTVNNYTSPEAVREIYIMQQLHHPNIMSLYRVDISSQFMRYWMPFTEGSLTAYRDTADKLFQKEKFYLIKHLMHQIFEGLSYLRDKRVVHMDMKPENCMILRLENDNLHLFISDFGNAFLTCSDNRQTLKPGTKSYTGPEHLLGSKKFCFSTDIWSAGVIFAELVFGKNIFRGATDLQILENVQNYLGPMPQTLRFTASSSHLTPPMSAATKKHKLTRPLPPVTTLLQESFANAGLNECGQDLMLRLLQYDPKLRITAKQALRHPYFCSHHPIRQVKLPHSST